MERGRKGDPRLLVKGRVVVSLECKLTSPASSFGSGDQKGKSSSVLKERRPAAEGRVIFPSSGEGNQCQLEYWSLGSVLRPAPSQPNFLPETMTMWYSRQI